MDSSLLVFMELVLIFGGCLTFAIWDIRAARQSRMPRPLRANAAPAPSAARWHCANR